MQQLLHLLTRNADTGPPPGATVGPRLQRSSLPELFMAMATSEQASGGLLVDDDVDTVSQGQLRQSDFLGELRTEVRRISTDIAVKNLRAGVKARFAAQHASDSLKSTLTGRDGAKMPTRRAAFAAIVDRERIGPLSWPGYRGESYTARVLPSSAPRCT